jgi:hypothetical protein
MATGVLRIPGGQIRSSLPLIRAVGVAVGPYGVPAGRPAGDAGGTGPSA